MYCFVPENIHTPLQRELEIPEGWGIKDPGNSRGWEGVGVGFGYKLFVLVSQNLIPKI